MAKNTLTEKINDLDAARQMYNTLRALTIRKVVDMLEAGECGIYTELAWTARKIEKRWSVMIGLKANREGALLEKDWTIRTVPEDRLPKGATVADAERQAELLRSAYEQIENLREALKFLHLAAFRGFAHLEKINAAGQATASVSDVVRLEPVQQWHMIRDGMHSEWRFDELLTGSYTAATPITPGTLIEREVEDPICEVSLPGYVFEMMGRKDWAGFVEVFGIPDIFMELPAGVTSDQYAEWIELLTAMAGDGRGLMPNGTTIQTAGGDVRGTNPFKEFVQFQREDVVMAGTGGQLTMMAESGTGTLAGGAQADVFDRIAKRDAREISEILQRAIDLPLLKERFPGQPPLAWFEIDAEDADDTTEVVNNVVALASQGYLVEPDQVQEKTGLRVTYDQPPVTQQEPDDSSDQIANRRWKFADLFNRKSVISNRQSKDPTAALKKNARTAIAQAIELDQRPISASLADLLDNTPDADLFQALEDWRDNTLPELTAKALEDPSAASAYEEALTASLFNGYLKDEA